MNRIERNGASKLLYNTFYMVSGHFSENDVISFSGKRFCALLGLGLELGAVHKGHPHKIAKN